MGTAETAAKTEAYNAAMRASSELEKARADVIKKRDAEIAAWKLYKAAARDEARAIAREARKLPGILE
jgi:hypothetical protein